jgi:hypothetical protein
MENISYSAGKVTTRELLSAVTATSAYTANKSEVVAGAKKIAVQFVGSAAIADRSGVLKLYGTLDGTNWAQLNVLVSNTANTNAQNLTRVASVTRNAAGNDLIIIDPAIVGALREIKADIAVTDSAAPAGTFTVVLNAQY